MSAKHCSFCKRFSSQVQMARICENCAVGRAGDNWCDFCSKTTNVEVAWICPECVKGRIGDKWCDFCGKMTPGVLAKICDRCTA